MVNKNNFNFLEELEEELDSTWNYGLGTAVSEDGLVQDRIILDRKVQRFLNDPEIVAEMRKISDEYTWFKLQLDEEDYEREDRGEDPIPARERSLRCEQFLSGLLKGEIEYHVANTTPDKGTGGDQVEVSEPMASELQSDDEQQSE